MKIEEFKEAYETFKEADKEMTEAGVTTNNVEAMFITQKIDTKDRIIFDLVQVIKELKRVT